MHVKDKIDTVGTCRGDIFIQPLKAAFLIMIRGAVLLKQPVIDVKTNAIKSHILDPLIINRAVVGNSLRGRGVAPHGVAEGDTPAEEPGTVGIFQ
jgi:hypothetical protein